MTFFVYNKSGFQINTILEGTQKLKVQVSQKGTTRTTIPYFKILKLKHDLKWLKS